MPRHSHHQTQWAAQFGAASELCKRGYQVALTMGNHPSVDIMVMSPGGRQFKIDVKGLYKANYWIIKRKPLVGDLYFVLAHVPADGPSTYRVLSHQQVIDEQVADIARMNATRARLSTPAVDDSYSVQGMQWGRSQAYLNEWRILPA